MQSVTQMQHVTSCNGVPTGPAISLLPVIAFTITLCKGHLKLSLRT